MKFLLIETASSVCSVATATEEKIISLRENSEAQQHASLITVFVDEVMKESGWTFRQAQSENEPLSAVVVSAGPGSYTGLRIGVSTAKGICYGANVPLIAINTLEALATGFRERNAVTIHEPPTTICSLFDARRDEVYYGMWNEKKEAIIKSQAAILNDDFRKAINSVGEKISFVGNGAEKVKSFLMNDENEYHSDFNPSSAFLLSLAVEKFNLKEFVDLAYFEPYYIKPFYFAEAKK